MPVKVATSLAGKEGEYCWTHVALSRVTKFANLGAKDTEALSKNRFHAKILKHPEMKNTY